MKPHLSNAHATAFGGNPKLQIPSSKQLGIRRRDHDLTEFFGYWDLGFGISRGAGAGG
jgi:hypothetical protein